MEHPKINLSNAQVGDEVEHFIHGDGIIIEVNNAWVNACVRAQYKNGQCRWYWMDGRSDKNDMHPGIVSHTPKKQKQAFNVPVTIEVFRDIKGRLAFDLTSNWGANFNTMSNKRVATIERTIPLEWEE